MKAGKQELPRFLLHGSVGGELAHEDGELEAVSGAGRDARDFRARVIQNKALVGGVGVEARRVVCHFRPELRKARRGVGKGCVVVAL